MPQSQFQNNDNIEARRLHPSMFGKIDMTATSAGDPGVSFTLVPFLELYDGLFFSEKLAFTQDEEENEEEE